MGKISVAMIGATALAACSAPGDSDPAAQVAAPTSFVPAIVSPTLLDVGTYPTTPRPPLGPAGNPTAGATADAQQLANYVIGPWETDKELISPYLRTFYLLDTPAGLAAFSPETVAQTANSHGFVNGFASARQTPDKTVMIHAVLRFPDPAAATAAATEMNRSAAQQAIAGVAPVPAPIPGHPESAASTYPFTPQGSDRTWAVIRSFTAHGPFVLMQVVQSVDGLDAAAALVQKAIDAQGPRIDEFSPADLNALDAVPLDPTGLLAKTLAAADNPGLTKNAVYDKRGAMHFQSNPVASKTLFTDTGVTAVAMAQANVYQARNPGSAKMVIDAFGRELTAQGATPADAVPNLPDSHCSARQKSFHCVALAGDYAIEINGSALTEVQQQVAAQYVLLTAG